MQNPLLIRTAAIATVSAAMIGAGWIALHGDDVRVDPAAVAVAGPRVEPAYYFPEQYTLQPNPAEAEVYEFY
jgi:hypothetical protein